MGLTWLSVLSPAATAQQCLEPSDPSAAVFSPLTVSKAGPAELRVDWEDVDADYLLLGGDLDRLWQGHDSHAPLVETAVPSAVISSTFGSRYFLVSARCEGLPGMLGQTSQGEEREMPVRARIVLALGGEGVVAGVQHVLAYPLACIGRAEHVKGLGPFDESAPGGPLTIANAERYPTRMLIASVLADDPGGNAFNPPADTHEVSLASFDLLLDASDVELSDCAVSDGLGNLLDSVTCFIRSFDVEPW